MTNGWNMIGEIGMVLIAAAVISAGLIVALKPLFERYALARPNARSSHRHPTPQGAGIAVIVATMIVVLIAIAWKGYGATANVDLAVLIAATLLIAAVGAVDDVRTVAVLPRLLLQVVAVGVVVAALPADLHVIPSLPWWIERALLVFAGVWFVNLTNFMDGIDWMTVAEVVPVAGGLAMIGMLGALPVQGVIVALGLCGAMLGFAPFNRPVAKVFLGDVGSLPIGLLLGWLLLLLAANGHAAAALLLPLYYLADTTITLMQRMIRREPFWQAHRTHFYQRATDNGFSAIVVVTRVFAVNVGLLALAVATVLAPGRAIAVGALVIGAGLVGWLLFSFVRDRR